MLDFSPKVLQFKVGKEVCEVRYPSISELRDYQKKLKAGDDQDQLDLVIDFLVILGAKKEIILNLTSGQLNNLIQALTNEEKKN